MRLSSLKKKIWVTVVVGFLALLLALWSVLQIPVVNQYALNNILAYVSSNLLEGKYAFRVNKFSVDITGNLSFDDVLILDEQYDTLIYAPRLELSLDKNILHIMQAKPSKVTLYDARIFLKETLFQQSGSSRFSWMDIKQYASSIPNELELVRSYIECSHPLLSMRTKVLNTRMVVNDRFFADATNQESLLHSLTIQSPQINILRYQSNVLDSLLADRDTLVYNRKMDWHSYFKIKVQKTINDFRQQLRSRLESIEGSFLKTEIDVQHCYVYDVSPQKWLQVEDLSFQTGTTDLGVARIGVAGVINTLPVSLQLVKHTAPSAYTTVSFSVDNCVLKLKYHLRATEFTIEIKEIKLDPLIYDRVLRKKNEGTDVPLEWLHLHGLMKDTKKTCSLFLENIDDRDDIQFVLKAFHVNNNTLSLDTFALNFKNTALQSLNEYLQTFNFPYHIQNFRNLKANATVIGDSSFLIKLSLDSLQLDPNASQTQLVPLQVFSYDNVMEKSKHTSYLFNINQHIKSLVVNQYNFTNVSTNVTHLSNDGSHHFSVRAFHESGRKAIGIDGLLAMLSNTSNFDLHLKTTFDSLPLSRIYENISESLKPILLSASLSSEVKQRNDYTELRGHVNDFNFTNSTNATTFDVSHASYMVQFSEENDLFEINIDKDDNITLWSHNMSADKLKQRLINHYHLLLKDDPTLANHMKDANKSELFELSVHAQKLTDLATFLDVGFRAKSVQAYLKTEGNYLRFFSDMEQLQIGESLKVRDHLITNVLFDGSVFKANIKADYLYFSSTVDKYAIKHCDIDLKTLTNDLGMSARLLLMNNHQMDLHAALVSIDSNLSYLDINDFSIEGNDIAHWRIVEDTHNSRMDTSRKITFTNSIQSVSIRPLFYRLSKKMDILVETENMEIGFLNDIFFRPKFEVDGFASVQTRITNTLLDPVIHTSGKIHKLLFNKSLIGNVDITQDYANSKMHLLIKEEKEKLVFSSTMLFSPTTIINMHIGTKLLSIGWLNQYLEGYVSRISGLLNGEADLEYNLEKDRLLMNGDVEVKNVACLIDATNCYYQTASGKVSLKDEAIRLVGWDLHDTLYSQSSLAGNILVKQKKSFGTVDVDLHFKANRILIYDNAIPNFSSYAAKIRGDGNLVFTYKNNKMKIEANDIVITDTSLFTVYNKTESQKTDDNLFGSNQIHIRNNKHKEQNDAIAQPAYQTYSPTYVEFTTNVKLNHLLEGRLFMDEAKKAENDFISVVGSGNVSFAYQSDQGATMYGKYTLVRMSDIPVGSLLISLDPNITSRLLWEKSLSPKLDIHTVAHVQNVDFSSLYTSIGGNSENLRSGASNNTFKSDMDLLIDVKGTAQNPEIKFDVELSQNSPLQGSQNLTFFLSRFRSNPDFAKSEVSNLILFKRFMGANSSESNAASLNTTTAVSGVLSSGVSFLLDKYVGQGLMQKALDNVLGKQHIKFNISSNFSSSASNANIALDKMNINVSATKSFLNDKVTLTVGSSFDYALTGASGQTSTNSAKPFTPNPSVDLQWRISQESNLFLGAFYRNSVSFENQLISGSQQQSSNMVGINWGMFQEFNSFKELFARKRRKDDEDEAHVISKKVAQDND